MTSQDAYIEHAKAQMAQWNAEITKMRADLEAAQSQGKAELARQLEELKQRRDAAEAELARLGEASGSAWDEMKASFDTAHDALAEGVEKARKQYTHS